MAATPKVRVALVGVDVAGAAPGGMASISRTLLERFAPRDDIDVVPITNFDQGSLARRLHMGLKAAVRVARDRDRIDLVHLQVADGWSIERDLVLVLIAKLRHLPVVAQYHGAGQVEDYERGNVIHRCFYRLLTRSCYNLALGHRVLDWLAELGCASHSEIIANGVPVPHNPVPLVAGVPRLAFVGRVGQRKGVFDLLNAAEAVANRDIDFGLDIVGDGELQQVEDRVRCAPKLRDKVCVLGWGDSEQVRQVVIRARALVLPSYAEALPMAILEAMAIGRPVISTHVGEISTAVHDGVNGFLVEAGDGPALERAMTTLLRDADLSARFGLKGHDIARASFSDEALDRLVDIYRDHAGLPHRQNEEGSE